MLKVTIENSINYEAILNLLNDLMNFEINKIYFSIDEMKKRSENFSSKSEFLKTGYGSDHAWISDATGKRIILITNS